MTRLGNLLKFGQLLKPLTTINLPKSPTFLGNFCKGVKIYHFSSEIIFGQLLQTFGNFFWSTVPELRENRYKHLAALDLIRISAEKSRTEVNSKLGFDKTIRWLETF